MSRRSGNLARATNLFFAPRQPHPMSSWRPINLRGSVLGLLGVGNYEPEEIMRNLWGKDARFENIGRRMIGPARGCRALCPFTTPGSCVRHPFRFIHTSRPQLPPHIAAFYGFNVSVIPSHRTDDRCMSIR